MNIGIMIIKAASTAAPEKAVLLKNTSQSISEQYELLMQADRIDSMRGI